MMNLVQGDCKCGALAFVAGENLSAATGLLVKLSSAGKAVKPSGVSDIAPYVVACGAFEGYLCGVVPLSSAANCRIALKGACQAGSLLVSAGDGRVEAGTLSGSAVPVGIAEETGVEGQRVLLRPVAVGGGGAGTPGPQGPGGAVGPQGPAGAPGAGLAENPDTGSLSGGSTASAAGPTATAFGYHASANANDACAYGAGSSATGSGGCAFGAYSYASGMRSAALGNGASAFGDSRLEIAAGYPAYSYGRISVQQCGAAMLSFGPSTAPSAGLAPEFNNPEGTLPPNMWTASLSGDGLAVVIYANVYGYVKSCTLPLT